MSRRIGELARRVRATRLDGRALPPEVQDDIIIAANCEGKLGIVGEEANDYIRRHLLGLGSGAGLRWRVLLPPPDRCVWTFVLIQAAIVALMLLARLTERAPSS